MSANVVTPEYRERLKWFHEARFGVFVHWGLYSLLERGEWVMYSERIPKEEYAHLAERLNPDLFDADKWVSLAKEAGAKYMVLTTRHHDGFCLFDSQVSDFTSVKTAAKRDFIREYADACRRHGLKVGFYYSLLDWRFPAYFQGVAKNPENWEALVQQYHGQVRELLTNYGKVDVLWYDGHWLFNDDSYGQGKKSLADLWRSGEVNAMARQLQPHIIINNRSGTDEDLDTPEQHVTASNPGRGWESCMTIGDSCGWGFTRHSPNRKSASMLIQYLCQAASGEGNFLLNMGPDARGVVPEEDAERLRAMGKWLQANGEAIYDSRRCPFGGGIVGTTTAKGNNAYWHIHRWPGTEAVIPAVANDVKSVTMLATGAKCEFHRASNGRVVVTGLPANPPDPTTTVLKLELDGEPQALPWPENL